MELSTFCYVTCADEGWTQYNIHLLCNLSRWCRICADEEWNSVQ